MRSAARSCLPYPYFYSDSDYYTGEAPQQPQLAVVLAPAPAPPPEPPAPRESLLIEWQGDHFVRTTSSSKNSAGALISRLTIQKNPLRLCLRLDNQRRSKRAQLNRRANFRPLCWYFTMAARKK